MLVYCCTGVSKCKGKKKKENVKCKLQSAKATTTASSANQLYIERSNGQTEMDAISFWSLEYLMGQWRPTIGDPTFMGWFTVGSYFGCAIFGAIIVLINRKADRQFFFFWSVITLLMILLGINKQLDLQSLFTEVGRQIAKAQGWMDHRGIVQFWFIMVFGGAATGAFLLFVIMMRDLFRRFTLAFAGVFFLLSFIILRASSFHHFDEMLGFRCFEVKMNWLLELTGIYLIFVAEFKEIFIEIVLLRRIRIGAK